jgi:hypothetical protein
MNEQRGDDVMRLNWIGFIRLALLLAVTLAAMPGGASAQDAPPAPPLLPETAQTIEPTAVDASDAALTTTFTYQGALSNGGQPATGAYDFRFRLFDAAANGAQVGANVDVGDVAVTDGIFTVQLSFGDVFYNTALYLEIGVRPGAENGNYTTLAPRQRLTAAPYASYARRAPWSGLTGVPAGFSDGVDNDTLYGAGNGLVVTNNIFAVNTALIQQRVASVCTAGSSIRAINQDGTVVCEVDDTASGGAWSLAGNAAVNPATQFLGTTDNVALNLRVNNLRAMRIEPAFSGPDAPAAPNIIGGHPSNSAQAGIYGAFIGGGGANGSPNQVLESYGTVGGGVKNRAGNTATVAGGFENQASGSTSTVAGGRANQATSQYATIGGGLSNQSGGSYAVVGGGQLNVASGSAATIAGGYLGTATDSYATVGGGSGNDATGDRATIAGGSSNEASALIASVGGGNGNLASALGATIGGGEGNQATGVFATIAGGRQAKARLRGQLAHASGMFTNPGDAQASTYVLRNRTTNATATELFLDGSGERLTVDPGRAMTFEVQIVARREGATEFGAYRFEGVIANFNGVMVLSKTGNTIFELNPTWNTDIQTNNTHDALQIVVYGQNNAAIRWVATVQTAEVVAP